MGFNSAFKGLMPYYSCKTTDKNFCVPKACVSLGGFVPPNYTKHDTSYFDYVTLQGKKKSLHDQQDLLHGKPGDHRPGFSLTPKHTKPTTRVSEYTARHYPRKNTDA